MNLEELIKLLMSKGIDVEDVLLDALSIKDPGESANERIRLVEKYMNEARDYLSKGDAVQAGEKLYKAAEEVIKALAEKYGVEHVAAGMEVIERMVKETRRIVLGDNE